MRDQLKKMIEAAVSRLSSSDSVSVEIERPTAEQFGDFSTHVAFVLAKKMGKKPREIADEIQSAFVNSEGLIESVSVAGAGFLNFRIKPEKWIESLGEISKKGSRFGSSEFHKGKKALVEFVSANPTGPLHIGNARGGPLGDAISSLLEAVGYQVTREFYVNDVGGQIDKLGESILAHYQNLVGVAHTGKTELGYQGNYVEDLARRAYEKYGKNIPPSDELGEFGINLLQTEISQDCLAMGIRFDSWVHEKEIIKKKTPPVLDLLKKSGVTYEKEGAVWFAPRDDFLADRECVLERSDSGRPTYFANDIAYHAAKYDRGFDLMVNVWGSNHHGHVPRILAALKVLGHDPSLLKTVLYQYVRIKRGAEAVKMSKRGGNFIVAREILDEVGVDPFRFFLLLKSPEAHLDFDIDLAKKQSSENPVYYVQYAHARICSIFKKAGGAGQIDFDPEMIARLLLPEEVKIAKELLDFPWVVEKAARELNPHLVAYYLMDRTRLFQHYYDRAREDPRYRVVSDDPQQTRAKLFFVGCVRQVLRNGLGILGISAPEQM